MFRALDETDSGFVSVILVLQCLGEENTEIVNTKKANARIQSTGVRDVDEEERCRGRREREYKRGKEEEEGEEEEEEGEEEEGKEEEEEEEEEYDKEDFNNNRSELGFLVLQALGRFMFSLLVNGLQKSIKSTQKTGGPVDPSLTWGEVRPLSFDHDNQITSLMNLIISFLIYFFNFFFTFFHFFH